MTVSEQRSFGGVPTRFWDRVGSRYDRQLWLERASVRTLLARAAPRADERLLDVGTGTGAVLRYLASRPQRPREAIGVDRSPPMLARVPALPAGWSAVQADARRLPFEDEAFDVVTASYLLHVLSERDLSAVLGELRRVLRRDGRLAVLTPSIPPGRSLRPVARALDRLAQRRPGRFGGLRALDPRTQLVSAGFDVAGVDHSLRGYPSICVLARPAR